MDSQFISSFHLVPSLSSHYSPCGLGVDLYILQKKKMLEIGCHIIHKSGDLNLSLTSKLVVFLMHDCHFRKKLWCGKGWDGVGWSGVECSGGGWAGDEAQRREVRRGQLCR